MGEIASWMTPEDEADATIFDINSYVERTYRQKILEKKKKDDEHIHVDK